MPPCKPHIYVDIGFKLHKNRPYILPYILKRLFELKSYVFSVTYILRTTDFALFLEDYLMDERHT